MFFNVELWPALYGWSLESGWQAIREPEKFPTDNAPQSGGYVVRTGKPRWSVGFNLAAPLEDAGLRCFVLDRGHDGSQWHEVAYTREPEEAEMIVAALEQTENSRQPPKKVLE